METLPFQSETREYVGLRPEVEAIVASIILIVTGLAFLNLDKILAFLGLGKIFEVKTPIPLTIDVVGALLIILGLFLLVVAVVYTKIIRGLREWTELGGVTY